MLKFLDQKKVELFLDDKPNLKGYIEKIVDLAQEFTDDSWYLSQRALPVKPPVVILELHLGLPKETDWTNLDELDQNIADCVSKAVDTIGELEGAVFISYCAVEDLENAYANEKEDCTTVLIDGF